MVLAPTVSYFLPMGIDFSEVHLDRCILAYRFNCYKIRISFLPYTNCCRKETIGALNIDSRCITPMAVIGPLLVFWIAIPILLSRPDRCVDSQCISFHQYVPLQYTKNFFYRPHLEGKSDNLSIILLPGFRSVGINSKF